MKYLDLSSAERQFETPTGYRDLDAFSRLRNSIIELRRFGRVAFQAWERGNVEGTGAHVTLVFPDGLGWFRSEYSDPDDAAFMIRLAEKIDRAIADEEAGIHDRTFQFESVGEP